MMTMAMKNTTITLHTGDCLTAPWRSKRNAFVHVSFCVGKSFAAFESLKLGSKSLRPSLDHAEKTTGRHKCSVPSFYFRDPSIVRTNRTCLLFGAASKRIRLF